MSSFVPDVARYDDKRARGIGLIGLGSVSASLLASLDAADLPIDDVRILVRSDAIDRARSEVALLGHRRFGVVVTDRLESLLEVRPLAVVETAGQGAVAEYGADVLASGIDFVPSSTGALADPSLRDRLLAASISGRSRIHVTNGAIGGLDIIRAAALSGDAQITYVSRKPPRAWRGSSAEALINLDGLQKATVFYSGTAREAALKYPRNANVAATVALAGVGFDDTRVQLIADPDSAHNVHEVTVASRAVNVTLRVEALPSAANPRTSEIVAHSITRTLGNMLGLEVF